MSIRCWLFGHRDGLSPQYDGLQKWCICTRCTSRYLWGDTLGLLFRKIHPVVVYPAGYGVAWWYWTRDVAAVMPVPFNVVAGLVRRSWHWLKMPRGLVADPWAAYREGLEEGRRQASGK